MFLLPSDVFLQPLGSYKPAEFIKIFILINVIRIAVLRKANKFLQSLPQLWPFQCQEEMAILSNILAWILLSNVLSPRTKKPRRLQLIGSQRVGHDCSNLAQVYWGHGFQMISICIFWIGQICFKYNHFSYKLGIFYLIHYIVRRLCKTSVE